MLAPLYRAKSRGGNLALIDWTALSGSFDWEREKLSIRLGDRADKITSLSGGNQQKVLIGRAFALSPNILILNDPARGVDIAAKTDLYAHLRDFAAAGKSVVYMSSEIEELIGFCSRVLVFRNGHVFAELTGEDINSDTHSGRDVRSASRFASGARRTRDAPRGVGNCARGGVAAASRLSGQPQRCGRLLRHFPCGPLPSPTAASFRTATPRQATSRRPSPGIRRPKARGASRSRLRILTCPPDLGVPPRLRSLARRRSSRRLPRASRGRQPFGRDAARGAGICERFRDVPHSGLRPRLWRPMAARRRRIATSSRSTR